MDQSHWAANTSTASQDIPRTLCTQKLHYRIYTSSSYAHILSQVSPVQVTVPHLISTSILCSNICQSCVFLPCFPKKHLYSSVLPLMCHMLHPSSTSWSENRKKISGEGYRSCNMRLSPPCWYFILLRHKHFPSESLSLCSSLNVTEPVSKPIQSKQQNLK